jgi:hypothetical protein
MSFRVNYDSIAAGFDRRYAVNDYSGVERALKAFVGPEFTGRVLEVGCGSTSEVQHLPVRVSARAAIEQGLLNKGGTSQLAVLPDEEYERGLDRGPRKH